MSSSRDSTLSAARKGVKPAAADEKLPVDPSWRIDFATLLLELAGKRQIKVAILIGSRPPPNDNVWKMAEQGGFKVTTHDRDAQGKEKAVDTDLVAQGAELICDAHEPDVLVIASDDRDFIPLVRVAHRRKWLVEMAAFQSAFSINGEMATEVDEVRPLAAIVNRISDYDYEWPDPATGARSSRLG